MVCKKSLTLFGAIFGFALAGPAWAQGNEDPIHTQARLDSGIPLWVEVEVGNYERTVSTSNNVYIYAEALHNGQQEWWADATVVTGGPSFTVTAYIPLGTFGLAVGDGVTVNLDVEHIEGPLTGTVTRETYLTSVAGAPPENPGAPVSPGDVHLEPTS